jgi:hypothetical protein
VVPGFKLAWRDRHPRIVQFWRGIDRAAIAAVQRAPQQIKYGLFTLECESIGDAKFLFITLPSGRRLSYPFPKIITNRFGHPAVEFMDNSIVNGQWTPCNHGAGAYGGLWAENLTQAVARDLLAAAMQRLEAAGYPVVLHVHDEIVCELPEGEGSLQEFKYLIERLPEWAAGLPIAAKVRTGPRFAEVDAAVVHVPGTSDVPPPRPKAKHKAAPVAAPITPPTDVARLTFTLAEACLDSTDPVLGYPVPFDAARFPESSPKPEPVDVAAANAAMVESAHEAVEEAADARASKRKVEPATGRAPPDQRAMLDYIAADMARAKEKAQASADRAPPGSDAKRTTSPPPGNRTPPPGGSRTAADDAADAGEDAGRSFDEIERRLLRRGYRFTRAFDYTLPDGTLLYQQRRYDLKEGIPAIKGRPAKTFRPCRQVKGQ